MAFTSLGDDPVPGDGNASYDTFVHDRNTGETTWISVDSAGIEGNGHCFSPSISANGRLVAFDSLADNLVPGDDNGSYDVFVHDRKTGETTRISVNSAGIEGNDNCFSPSISASGRFVAFQSLADNVVPGDGNASNDIFVHDRKTGETTRVSVDSVGSGGNDHCFIPSISANGRLVAFQGRAGNLVPGDGNVSDDIFVHDRKTGETTRVSVDSGGIEAGDFSFEPAISPNGRLVAFKGRATNLVPGDGNVSDDVFVHERKTGETTRVSLDSAGVEGNGTSYQPSISANGRFVAFGSVSGNLVEGDGNASDDVFVHDRK